MANSSSRSPWTHALCAECYGEVEEGRKPANITPSDPETCCKCGETNSDGIFYRCDPSTMKCKGEH